jgi:glycolate oxidase FAD binding subunit
VTLRPVSVAELSAVITDAASSHRALRLVGRGTWLDGGEAVAPGAEPLHLDAFDGIIEYEPGDLTITVGAATTIAELDAVTATHGQWCPLSPWGGDDGSVGATIATATAGPLSHALGRPRDLVLGLECVDGTGKVLRPGGKVVKNVAGFDLVRLMTGAWGTLGAITRVSLRLRARPAVDETWRLEADADRANEWQERLRRGVTPPIACELVEARRLSAADPGGLLVRLAGNAAFVAAARDVVCALGDATPVDSAHWTALRRGERARVERAPLSPVVRALNDGVKHAFDPAGVLNPGILG